jgi:hypothetical protein
MEGWKPEEESLSIYESPNPCGVLIGLPVWRNSIELQEPWQFPMMELEYIHVDN